MTTKPPATKQGRRFLGYYPFSLKYWRKLQNIAKLMLTMKTLVYLMHIEYCWTDWATMWWIMYAMMFFYDIQTNSNNMSGT